MKNKTLVVFGEDFGRAAHCLEHLMTPLFQNNKILWVETAGLRGPKFSWPDFKRSLVKIMGWLRKNNLNGRECTSSTKSPLAILRPITLPWWGNQLIANFNDWSIKLSVTQWIKKQGLSIDYVISSLPTLGGVFGQLDEKVCVYYCVDEFKLWPGFPSSVIEKREAIILKKSDLVLCTSLHLLTTRIRINPQSVLFTHGVDRSKFMIPIVETSKGKTIFGYYGIIDERCDQSLLRGIVERSARAEIHIWGKTTVDVSLLKHPQIVFHGHIPYSQLADKIKIVEVFLLPYLVNDQTRTIYPLKIKEYLLSGRPVVATSLPDLEEFKNFILLATDSQDFVQKSIKLIGQKSYYNPAQIAFVSVQDWSNKTDLFTKLIEDIEKNKKRAHQK